MLTVVGGPHVSAVPEEFLNSAKNLDIGMAGEGEYAMLDIVKMHEGQRRSKKFRESSTAKAEK